MGNLKRALLTFGKAETSACFASVVDFGVTILLAEVVHVWYAYATFVGAVSGGVVNCCINYKWVFCPEGLTKRGVAFRYLVVWGGSIFFNTSGTYLLTEWTGANFIIMKTLVACVVATLWNYQMQRVYVFQTRKKRNE